MLDAVEHAARLAGFRRLRADKFHIAFGMRKNCIRPGHSPHLDGKNIRKPDAVVFAQKHQLTICFSKAAAIGHLAIHAAFFKTEDGAIWGVLVEHLGITCFVKMRDAALLVKPGVQLLGRSQLDQLTRHNENQLTAGLEMANALFDKEQEKIAATIEEFRFQAFFGVDRNILKTDIGRVTNDGVELFAQRIIEKIANLGTLRGNR